MINEKCSSCLVAMDNILMKGESTCIIVDKVLSETAACAFYVRAFPEFQHCSNCKNFIQTKGGNPGCKKKLCFPKDNQINVYISCNGFEPKTNIIKEAYIYYKNRCILVELLLRSK